MTEQTTITEADLAALPDSQLDRLAAVVDNDRLIHGRSPVSVALGFAAERELIRRERRRSA